MTYMQERPPPLNVMLENNQDSEVVTVIQDLWYSQI